MKDIDKQSPEYLAGRSDMANELVAEAEQRQKKDLTIEEIKRMKPDEVNARWDEVQKVMAAHS